MGIISKPYWMHGFSKCRYYSICGWRKISLDRKQDKFIIFYGDYTGWVPDSISMLVLISLEPTPFYAGVITTATVWWSGFTSFLIRFVLAIHAIGGLWEGLERSCHSFRHPKSYFESHQLLIRPFEKRTYYAVAMSVRPRFPDFPSTCFEISIWKLVYTFSRCHDMSSLGCITIRSFWRSLQPKVGQAHFLQPWPHKSR